jgi:hypothetical protein
VFRHHYSTVATVVCKIKEEARVWSLAGAKFSSNVIPEEYAFIVRLGFALAML